MTSYACGMATTLHDEHTATAATETEVRSPWLLEPGGLSSRWVSVLALAWCVVFFGSVLIEPAPTNPDAAEPLWAALVEAAFFGALLTMVAGFTGRSRLGALASFAGAGVFLTMVVACPVTGHHTIGAWWYLQVAGTAGLGAASVAALRSS
jgi:hypothetical protein